MGCPRQCGGSSLDTPRLPGMLRLPLVCVRHTLQSLRRWERPLSGGESSGPWALGAASSAVARGTGLWSAGCGDDGLPAVLVWRPQAGLAPGRLGAGSLGCRACCRVAIVTVGRGPPPGPTVMAGPPSSSVLACFTLRESLTS